MNHDVIIVGAGPAGASLAALLAGAGARVLCVDRSSFPRHKVCGEFISPEAGASLSTLGLGRTLQRAASITRYGLTGPNNEIWEGDFPSVTETGKPALGLSRWTLDDRLVSKAREAGAEVAASFTATGIAGKPGRWILTGRRRGSARPLSFKGDWLVGADGQDSFVRRAVEGRGGRWSKGGQPLLGFKAHFRVPAPPQVNLAFFRGGYVGANPVESGETNVCFVVQPGGGFPIPRTDAELDAFVRRLFRTHHDGQLRLADADRSSPWFRTGGLRFGPRSSASGGALFVGDAAGAIDPFAGGGISMGLRGAEILAALLSGADPSPDGGRVPREYSAAWRAEFGRRMRWAGWLRRVVRRPGWTNQAVRILTRNPGLGRHVIRATRSPGRAPRAVPPDGRGALPLDPETRGDRS